MADTSSDYDQFSELTRQLLMKRLTHEGGQSFALACFTALVKDGQISRLLDMPSTRTNR